ncbi:colorectal mutant cancer protein isoform X2 [Gouania willdenowi]|uniref:colorectal mutant cancer protein isoform X2 n=1 Tax=Gouania willdenowi TaxID=441366 RepID=UPI00105424EB|nr:Usher syndrome type-1C protein-binding protein 1 isoform X2 [Gouania willdenowi]
MEDFRRGRCDSLDSALLCDNVVVNSSDQVILDLDGPDPGVNLEPSPAELAQCEAEIGTLLGIIAELNKKMGSLKAPSDPGETGQQRPSRPLVPDLLSHQLSRKSPERSSFSAVTSKPERVRLLGGSGVVWTKLQEVLSTVEDSISFRRTWATPITASDQDKHQEHLRAAQESWVKATMILEEMEKEFGISCPLRKQDMDNQQDIDKEASALRNTPSETQSLVGHEEDERNKEVSHLRFWRSGSLSPSYHSSARTPSPDWATPPFPGSPLLNRRSNRSMPPLSVGGDGSRLGSVNSGSPCPSPISLEVENERLNRYIDRLKARNERLTAALERRRSESEQMGITMNRLQSDCLALRTALRYSEECETAYSELLSLSDARKQQRIPLQPHTAASPDDEQQQDSPSAQLRSMTSEELSTSFSTAETTEETQTLTGERTPVFDREAVLRQQIEDLKRERAAICLNKPYHEVEAKPGPEGYHHPSGSRIGHINKDYRRDNKKEKPSLIYELISVREEMSDLRSLIRLKEKELRCLEWSLMSQKAQEAAGVFIPESLREELEDQKPEQQRFSENAAKLSVDGDIMGSRSRPFLKELQIILQREQALKKRLALAHNSDADSSSQIAWLTQAHSSELIPADP